MRPVSWAAIHTPELNRAGSRRIGTLTLLTIRGPRSEKPLPDGKSLHRTPRATRGFVSLWTGQAVSMVGSEITIVAAPVVAVTVLGVSAAQVGLLSAAQTVAFLLVALPAGLLADRLGPLSVMLGSSLARFLFAAMVCVLLASHHLTFSVFLVLTALSGGCLVLYEVAYPTVIPKLVPPPGLASANAKLGATQSIAQVLGPSAGGFIVGFAGAAVAYLIDAFSFLVSLATLAFVRRGKTADTAVDPVGELRPPHRADLTAGLRFLMRDRILRAGMLWSGTANIFVVIVETIGTLYLLRTLGLSPAVVGVLLASAAAGGVAGALLLGPISRILGSSRATWLAMTLFALPGLLIPMAGHGASVVLFAVGWVSWSFSATIASINLLTYRQQNSPPEILGRVNACYRWVSWGTLPLGGLLGGGLATWVGVRATLWIAVSGGCASGLWLLFSPLRDHRDLPLGPAVPNRAAS